ncbi:MAG: cytochrome c3 family protein [Deltaproteobacteria bacterium]|nr:MAG: cytochrome c3 family protein [Deltaproteobacteria bacterium]
MIGKNNKAFYGRGIFLSLIALSFVISLGFVALCLSQALRPELMKGPPPITFTNPHGSVLFDHEKHDGLLCSECHPPFDYDFSDDSEYSTKAHDTCVSCHEKSEVSTDCNSCHQVHQGKESAPN